LGISQHWAIIEEMDPDQKAQPMQLPDPVNRPTLSLWPDVAGLLGIGRSAVYAAAERGEIPTLRFGRRLVVPTAALRQMLGLDSNGGSNLVVSVPPEGQRPEGER
jgi:excisionase family DNA binding protein